MQRLSKYPLLLESILSQVTDNAANAEERGFIKGAIERSKQCLQVCLFINNLFNFHANVYVDGESRSA